MIAVHDGLPQKLKRGGGSQVAIIQSFECIKHVSNDRLYERYPSLLPAMLLELLPGYEIADWRAAGASRLNLNWAAVLTVSESSAAGQGAPDTASIPNTSRPPQPAKGASRFAVPSPA